MVNITELREKLGVMGLPQNVIEDTIANVVKERAKEAVEEFSSKLAATATHDALADIRMQLAGTRLKGDFVFDEDGEVEVSFTLSRSGASAGARGGGGRKVLVDGTEYGSSAAACRALDLEYEGRSAWAVLQKAQRDGVISELSRPK